MRTLWRGLLIGVVSTGLLAGCGGGDEGAQAPTEEDTISAIQQATGEAAQEAEQAMEEGAEAVEETAEQAQESMEEAAEDY